MRVFFPHFNCHLAKPFGKKGAGPVCNASPISRPSKPKGGARFKCRILAATALAATLSSLSNGSVAAGRVFYDGFESGFGTWGGRASVVTSGADGGSARAGSKMAKLNWNGRVAWNDPAAQQLADLDSFSYNSEFLVRWWWRADQNFDLAHGCKLIRFGGGPGYYVFMQESEDGLNLHEQMFSNPKQNATQIAVNKWVKSTVLADRQWHKEEVYVRIGSPGVLKRWHDGQLVYSENVTTTDGTPWYPLHFGSNWSLNAPSWAHDENNNVYLDEVEIFSDAGSGAAGSLSDASASQGGSVSQQSQTPPAPPPPSNPLKAPSNLRVVP